MRKNLKVFQVDLQRAFYKNTLLISVMGCMFVLFLNTEDYYDGYDVSYYIQRGLDGMYAFMLYLFATVPYSGSFLLELKNHYTHLFRIRSGNRFYLVSKVFAVFLSGFVTVALGCIFYIAILAVKYPLYNVENVSDSSYQILILQGNVEAYLGITILLQGFLGGTFAVLAFCFSAFINNIYAVWVFPVVFYYVWMNLDYIFHFPLWISFTAIVDVPFTGDIVSSVFATCVIDFVLMVIAAKLSFGQMRRRLRDD